MCRYRPKRKLHTTSSSFVSAVALSISFLIPLALAARAQAPIPISVIPSLGKFATFGTFSPHGNLWLAGSGTGIYLWDVKSAKLIRSYSATRVDLNYIMGVFFTEDGRSFSDGMAIRDVETGKVVRSFNISADADGTAVSRHNHLFAYWKAGKIVIRNYQTGRVVCTLSGHVGWTVALGFSHDG